MLTITRTGAPAIHIKGSGAKKKRRVESIDLLRGTVMIIMALDHVRHWFHRDSFFYDPLDLNQTSPFLFFTRFITHYCAPVFVFLAGVSAYLSGAKKTKEELSRYLFSRGLWLVFTEIIIITLAQTFNPLFPFFNLQVIWAIGISMIVMSGMIFLERQLILIIAVLLIAGHNLLDGVHVTGTGLGAFGWSVLHDPKDFSLGHFYILIKYPVLPWIGIMALGYSFGTLYEKRSAERKKALLYLGLSFVALFLLLRSLNIYGDAAHWSVQKNLVYSILSFLDVTKYPPSLLYTLITLGPALIFLSLTERPLNNITKKIAVFGRVPFFYYVVHLFTIHLLVIISALITGYRWTDMLLVHPLNRTPALKGFGFSLATAYLVWAGLIVLLYPFCKWFDQYKKANQAQQKWLTYV